MGGTNYRLSAEDETEREEIESRASSEEFVVAEESEIEFSGSASPSNIWLELHDPPVQQPVDPRVIDRVYQWQFNGSPMDSDKDSERYKQFQYATSRQQIKEDELEALQRKNDERSQPSIPGSGSGCRYKKIEIHSDIVPLVLESSITEDGSTLISDSTRQNPIGSALSSSMTPPQSFTIREALTDPESLNRVCTIDKRVHFLKATVILGFMGFLAILGYSFWPTPNPRGHNDDSMLQNEENRTLNNEGNLRNFYWEGNELKTYIQYKNNGTYAMKRYDYELLEIQPVESYLLPLVMHQFQCEETKWVESFVCCHDPKSGTVCARRLENNDWALFPHPFYRAEFLKKNGQDYLVAQERLNTMPYLIDSMGTEITIETQECSDAFHVLRFDITNEKIAIVFEKRLSRDKSRTNQSLLLIDPFDENDHKCFQREGLSLGKLRGIWVDRDVVWILFCRAVNSCSVHLLTLEDLMPIYYYPISHEAFAENSMTRKHEPRFVGKTEKNNLNIYTFVNGNDSAKIIRKRISFLDNNPKIKVLNA